MSEPSKPKTPAVPVVERKKKRAGLSPIWLVPVMAAAIGIWIAGMAWMEQGPTITISFNTAQGLEPGKTRIKHKDVEVGKLVDVVLKDDHSGVVVTAELQPRVANFLTTGTRFWVVRPRLSIKGVTGLSTLVSGAYIEIEPGFGVDTKHFAGLESPPVVRADVPGRKYVLQVAELGSLSVGSPIYFRGIQVGEVLGHELEALDKEIDVHIFVNAPYHHLVRENSRFWNRSGLNITLDANGMKVKMASMQALLVGGVAFETPADIEGAGPEVPDGTTFRLFRDRSGIDENLYTQSLPYVMFFNGSVRGLKPGAPVEFRGIKVGSVTDVKLEYDAGKNEFFVPVFIQIQPERINIGGQPAKVIENLITRGLRAQLRTGNLLTGQLFVDLDLHPDSRYEMHPDRQKNIKEIPTVLTSLDEITHSVTEFLEKVQSLPLDTLSDEVLKSVRGVNDIIYEPALKGSVITMKNTLNNLEKMVADLSSRMDPMTEDLHKTIQAARKTLDQTTQSLTSIENVVAPDSALHYDIQQAVRELTATSRSIRRLTDYLERNPDSLLFGKGKRQAQ
ncbi:MAG: MCE family protein [Magnetococcales bacterium]|nr:MCE family protein [Magnetococcales bacterium]